MWQSVRTARLFSTRLIYKSATSAEPWLATGITAFGLSAMLSVAYYEAVPGLPYLAAGLAVASVAHIRNCFIVVKQKAVQIEVEEGTERIKVTLKNGEVFEIAGEELKFAEEAPFPNDFKLLRKAETVTGKEFYLSYSGEVTEEGKKILKLP